MRHRPLRLPGFTLVELLAVLAIIGTLVGLLLPAVQRVRDSARRTHCSNNLRQMGVGLTNYEQANRRFPPGNEQTGQRFHAWSSYILPFLENSEISDRINYTKPWDDPGGNAALADKIIPTYVCPAGMKSFPGKQDYGGVLGAYIDRDGNSLAIVNSRDLRHLSSGVLYATGEVRYVPPRYDAGTVPTEQPRRPATVASVTDGLSKTLLVTEGVDRFVDGADDTRRSGAAGWATGNNCFGLGFRVVNVPDEDGFRSLHFGGLFGLFGDGHVHFIGETVDAPVLIAISTRNGGEREAAEL